MVLPGEVDAMLKLLELHRVNPTVNEQRHMKKVR
jgi:hypothetical protein